MRLSISVAIAGLLCFSAYVSAQPNKQSYEPQEQCGKRAAEVFEREYGPVSDDKDGQTLFNYENHYSPRLKKCFFLEIAMSYEREEEKPGSKIMRLFDLNENREYGTLSAVLLKVRQLHVWYEAKTARPRVNGGNF